MRSIASWRCTILPQVMSPTSLTTSTTQRLLKSSSRSNPATRSIGRALSSPLFNQEREEPADRRQANHYFEESLSPAQSFSVCHSRTGRPVHELCSLNSCSKEKPSRDSENERIKILLERQKEQILAYFRAEIHKHEFQADSDWRSIQELNEIIESQRREIDHTIARDEQFRRDQLLLHEQLITRTKSGSS